MPARADHTQHKRKRPHAKNHEGDGCDAQGDELRCARGREDPNTEHHTRREEEDSCERHQNAPRSEARIVCHKAFHLRKQRLPQRRARQIWHCTLASKLPKTEAVPARCARSRGGRTLADSSSATSVIVLRWAELAKLVHVTPPIRSSTRLWRVLLPITRATSAC